MEPLPQTKTSPVPGPDSASGTTAVAKISTPRPLDRWETMPAPWREPLIIAIFLSMAAIGGFTLTDNNPQRAAWYWLLILPVFAAVAIWHTWKSIRDGRKTNWPLARRQIFTWLALLVTIKVLFVLIYKDKFAGEGAGLVALLLIALTCAHVGINFDWVFLPVGIILACTVVMATLLRQYAWLLLAGQFGALFVLEFIRWMRRLTDLQRELSSTPDPTQRRNLP